MFENTAEIKSQISNQNSENHVKNLNPKFQIISTLIQPLCEAHEEPKSEFQIIYGKVSR